MNVPHPPKASHTISEEKALHPTEPANRRATVISAKPQVPSPPLQTTPQPAKAEITVQVPEHQSNGVSIEGLSLVDHGLPAANGLRSAESAESIEDEQSNLSNSSTKQQSFDTKSMASVTTFAMDEKESIRPDDSASVRAADDEDVASTVSRNGSFPQESSVIMPTLRGGAGVGGPSVTIAARRYPTLTNPPRFGDLELPPVPQSEVSETPSSSAAADQQDDSSIRVPPPPISPDEKLLDALASPKDRLPILQLEERLLGFIAQSSIDFIDLPPQHSYARLLAHKLADYYSLLHRINEDGISIRIYRTSTSQLPPPLTVLAQSIPVGSSQSLPTAVKIMRRAAIGIGPRQLSTTNSTAPSSSVPSNTTSEAGHSEDAVTSPTDGTPGPDKSKMTREEREAQYKAARERIFGDFQELAIGESVSTGENSADMSRSSSSSGMKKARRQKTPKDDSFEARSAFVSAGYGGSMHVQAPYQSHQYLDQHYQTQYDNSPAAYGPPMNYGSTPTQAYPGFDQMMQASPVQFSPMSPQNLNMIEGWPGMQPQPANNYLNLSQAQSGYQHNAPSVMAHMSNQYLQQPPVGMQQPGGWVNPQYQNPYQAQISPAQGQPNWPNYQSQQYGQVPNQFPMHSPMSTQNSLANSFNRSLFNPQTRSFIPGAGGPRSGPRNGRKKNPPMPPHQLQSRNSSGAKSHASSSPSTATMMPPRGPAQEALRSNSSSSLPQASEESLQKKYGTPANLPKKPPPSQVPSQFDVGNISTVKPPSGVRAVDVNLNSNGDAENGDNGGVARDIALSS